MSRGGKQSSHQPRSVPTLAEHHLLECIRYAQQQYLRAADSYSLFSELLNNILALTDSRYGFIGEVFYEADGSPYIKTRAHTNVAWDKVTQALYRHQALHGLDFRRLDSLYGAVLTSRQAVISNSPATDPRRCGVPDGHPVLDSFLGLPLLCGDRLVGMVGMANRAQGYDQALVDYLAPLTETTALLVQAYRCQSEHQMPPSPQIRETVPVQPYAEQISQLQAGDTLASNAACDALRAIAAAISAQGEPLYTALTRTLTQLLGADVAYIGLFTADHADVVAFCEQGAMRANFRYALAGAPCADIGDTPVRHVATSLAAAFPEFALAQRYGLDSYLASAITAGDGRVLGLVAVAHRAPLSQPAVAEALLGVAAARIAVDLMQHTVHEKLRTLTCALDQTADAVMITDHANLIEYVNPAFTAITGFGADEVLGKNPAFMQAEAAVQQPAAMLDDDQPVRDVVINRKKSGECFYEEKTITALKDAGGVITHYIYTGKDLTERMQVQERLHRLVYYDPLTELPNRRLFLECLGHALARHSLSGARLAVLCLDVDHLKVINDTYGHDFGDKALQALAALLSARCRAGDTVARLGGDEFAMLLENVASEADVLAKVNELLSEASQVLHIDGDGLYATLCIGIAFAPADGSDAPTVLDHADAALCRAKQRGRHAYHFYSADLSACASQRLDIETRLRRALERHEFHLCYQPQLDLIHGNIVGCEALLRWQPAEDKLIGPENFIPALEDTGLIVPVGEWVLRQACEQAAEWLALGTAPVRLSVNVSGRQLMQRDFLPFLRRMLGELQFPAPLLELEITESVLMQDDATTEANLDGLREMGVRLAIDDFGTGYSSLGYLKRFAVEALKIDRSFVRDVTHNKDDAAIIAAIIAMAHSLGLDVIAEGIETPEQLRILRLLGCRISQGFLFSPPLSSFGLLALLQPAHLP